jgi:hypothetical protein
VHELWGFTQTQVKTKWPEFMDEKEKKSKMFDDVGMVPPDIWSQTDEGRDLPIDDFGQGYVTHYEQEKFAKMLVITEEMEEWGKYPEIYDGSRMLSYTEKLTEDYYAVQFLNDAATTANGRVGGDGKAMLAIDHPLRGNGTAENVFSATATAPPLSPSNTAIGVTLVKIERTVSENGRIDSTLKGMKCVGPSAYRFRFKEILKSSQKDDTSNNTINALSGELEASYVAVPLMTSQLNWFMKTNVKKGSLSWFWGRKPRMRKVSHEENETTKFLGSAYWTGGHTDWRTYFGHIFE